MAGDTRFAGTIRRLGAARFLRTRIQHAGLLQGYKGTLIAADVSEWTFRA
jgi:hypothetical protein